MFLRYDTPAGDAGDTRRLPLHSDARAETPSRAAAIATVRA
jgi:hypothetical protein